MKLENPESKRNLLNRLKRIEGQVRGVQTMVEDERDCREILQQLSSIRSAVQGASLDFLQEYATECLLHQPIKDGELQREQLVKDIVMLIGKGI
ncbi:MAG: metal-sensitive transcriptional regulator [Methanosarcina sp.]|nr:metal-sensitive transcriptional regulator [Methanosarcina sp.]